MIRIHCPPCPQSQPTNTTNQATKYTHCQFCYTLELFYLIKMSSVLRRLFDGLY